MERYKKKRRKLIAFSLAVLGLILALIAAFLIYALVYYRADNEAMDVYNNSARIEAQKNITVLKPDEPSGAALIFYPGAKVEHIAYAPLLDKLVKQGVTCVLIKMPLNMAIFNSDAADEVFDKVAGIDNWYIGGHSMGGAMASKFASENKDKVSGLILLGAYVYGDYPPEKALTVYGSFNSNLEKNIDYTENIVVIEGGNHAYFGNYGEQKGDVPATISRDEQQNIAVTEILKFIGDGD
ncbi:MAG: alpha/beta fold hydrolase [Clostridia bacterium]